jgi:hypothetical protein
MVVIGSYAELLGPLVEHIVLLDRCIAISELGYEASLKVLFNRDISPRNIAVLATK